ncbi:TatD family hydrolase [Pantoea sp. 1.19]|uniref:TatD family hydrolase n=1 Tax=Pantoea sp. 1.19 TaxID=1925589 RepID=UPI000948DC20|nr:TatD family hydrolase [Pantoea sp. 1.19]
MSLRFVDTHCHFDFPPFVGDEAASLARAAAAGVERLIAVSVSAARFAPVLALAAAHPPVYAALGLHPMAVAEHDDGSLAALEQQLRRAPEKLVAVGEIGLDKLMADPQFARQQALLDAQLRLARQYDLPVILHARRSHDTLAMHLRRQNLPRGGVVHGFAGSLAQAEAYVRLGYLIGVGGTITYPRANKTRQAIARLPLSALLLETDAPDMPVSGFQGQPNRPERIVNVFHALCALRPEPAPQIAQQIRANTHRLFRI